MRTAERLIANKGMGNVSIREIVAGAKQKNESALQYHFKNFSGLVEAILVERALQTHQRRAELIEALSDTSEELDLRSLCLLMVLPAFELARQNHSYRHYIRAFGHAPALTDSSPLSLIARRGGGGESGKHIGQLLRKALPHLDEVTFHMRMDSAVRLCSTSMYHQARQKQAFKGKQADFFLQDLVDSLVGLLSAQASEETARLKRSMSS